MEWDRGRGPPQGKIRPSNLRTARRGNRHSCLRSLHTARCDTWDDLHDINKSEGSLLVDGLVELVEIKRCVVTVLGDWRPG